jgi:hypothetical protein
MSSPSQDIRLARRMRLTEAWRVVTAAFTSYPLHLHRHIIAIIVYCGRCHLHIRLQALVFKWGCHALQPLPLGCGDQFVTRRMLSRLAWLHQSSACLPWVCLSHQGCTWPCG